MLRINNLEMSWKARSNSISTTIFFPLVDNLTNPLTGSRVTLTPIDGAPYFTGSIYNPTGSFGGPTVVYSDSITGVALFTNVIRGLYRVSYTGINANQPKFYTKYDETNIFIQVDDNTTGLPVNGFTIQVTSINNTADTLVAWSTQASDARYLNVNSGAISAVSSSFGTLIPQIQSGQISYFTGTSAVITFNTPFLNTNYSFNVFPSGSMGLSGSRISAPLATTGVTLSFAPFSGSLHWIAISSV